MAATAYRLHSNKASEVQIVSLLSHGFTGTLREWWDHYLTPFEKRQIYESKKIKEENGTTTQESDAVAALIWSIFRQFIGEQSSQHEKNSVILLNLTCPKLSDFQWYKDIFIAKVMSRPDGRSGFWKEKFISGLPKLFAQRVRDQVKETLGTNYESITYGQIVCTINHEGLKLCNELKMQSQMKSEFKRNKGKVRAWLSKSSYPEIPVTQKKKFIPEEEDDTMSTVSLSSRKSKSSTKSKLLKMIAQLASDESGSEPDSPPAPNFNLLGSNIESWYKFMNDPDEACSK
ncbi:uncharacterized protein LOC131153862 [Malania oleifera]|uniref:uncharacterized protein LOC131153862 n=1 Tax=Malania oleifera TaxID=397392 RepID=UPI0025AE95AA|nr:uncharacterized protein LOC131153862 [Malania oleifera]